MVFYYVIMSSTDRNSMIIFFIAVIPRLLFHVLTNFVADDAYITFRYAENIAHSLGFVYNEGERVLGTSTPLFTMLLSLLKVFGAHVTNSAISLGFVFSGATAVLLYRMALKLRMNYLAIIPPLLYIFFPRSIVAETCGMETGLFVLLTLGAFYQHLKDKYFYAIGFATLSTLTRPEGLWLLILLLSVAIYKENHRWKKYIMTPLMLIVPWVAFSSYYFGSPVPHSVPAKLALYARFGAQPFLENFIYYLNLNNPIGRVIVIGIVFGCLWLFKKQNRGQLMLLWLCGMVLFYTFSRTVIFFWYAGHIIPIAIILASPTIIYFAEKLKLSVTATKILPQILIPLLIILMAYPIYRKIDYYKEYQNYLEHTNLSAANYLFAHADRESDIAACEDIGYIGYYSKLNILDRDGLISPEAVPYNRAGYYYQLIDDYKPDWVGITKNSPISQFTADSLFLRDYRLEKEFLFKSNGYQIYSRIKN